MVRLIVLLLVSAAATSAAAQTQPSTQTPAAAVPAPEQTPTPAPNKAPRREPPQTMMLTVSLSGSDTDDGPNGDSLPIVGFHTGADALVEYKHKVGRATISATGRSVFLYAPSSETFSTTYDQGQLAFSMVTAHTRFEASQMVSYSPYYQFGALPDATPSPITATAQSHGDYANSNVRALGSTTGIDFSRTISRRDTLSFNYNLRRTTFNGQNLDTTTSQGGGVLLLHQLSRSVALRTGYGYRSLNSVFTQGGFAHNHDLDVGVDYNRALGLSKRTTLGFVSGVSATPDEQGIAFNPTGNVSLSRQIGRTWRTRVAASRSVELLEGFRLPVVTNSGIFDVGGKLGRRTSVSTSAAYSRGVVGVNARDATSYDNWSGTVGMRYMLSRFTALDTQYSYYGHHFDQGAEVWPGAVRLKRQGVRVSFTWLHPVLR